jgi:hypothetical protein
LHEFVAAITDFWKDPSPHRIPELLHPDVILVQPLAAPMIRNEVVSVGI